MLDHIFQQTVKRLPILCEMLRYLDTDFPHDKILGAVFFFRKQGAAVFLLLLSFLLFAIGSYLHK